MIKRLCFKNKKIFRNLDYNQLRKHEIMNKEGELLKTKYGDVFSINTGKFTGRSPNDKWIVKNVESKDKIWWGEINKPISNSVFDNLLDIALDNFNNLDSYYVYDGYCGANKNSEKKVRFVHELAWQQHFVSNMFINKTEIPSLDNFDPDFTIINACSKINKEWQKQGLHSENAIAFNIEEKIGVILGTWYGGENKKGIFSLMNYWLPQDNILPMHCSANVGKEGDTCLFFGLSGTGKTTLSADPNRYLIGDDEHGWDDEGIFNFEGGCYAKTINLNETDEPDIYKAIKPNALLENVYYDENKVPDYNNVSITQNGRVSYPINHIANWHKPQTAGHPNNIIFLTCDAFGVLPAVSKLTPEQALDYFLMGYTAKVAGTERGINSPTATFSPCFGAAFLTLPPYRYANLLKEKIEKHNTNVYLVNTGWVGGTSETSERISIRETRRCIDLIVSNKIESYKFVREPYFGLELPIVNDIIQSPIFLWENKQEYIKIALQLKNMFLKDLDKKN